MKKLLLLPLLVLVLAGCVAHARPLDHRDNQEHTKCFVILEHDGTALGTFCKTPNQ